MSVAPRSRQKSTQMPVPEPTSSTRPGGASPSARPTAVRSEPYIARLIASARLAYPTPAALYCSERSRSQYSSAT